MINTADTRILLMIIDIKSYTGELKFDLKHVSQLNRYCNLLRENGFEIDGAHRMIIYTNQKRPISTIKPIIQWINQSEFKDKQYRHISTGIVNVLHWS